MGSQIEKAKQAVASTRVVTVKDFMESQRGLIAKVLPKTITPDRMLGIFTMILKSTPVLANCSQQSLIGAVIQTAQLGLQPGNIGHIYLVPFQNKGVKEVQLIIGYKGLVELVNRSGKASILNAEVVYENDTFQYEQGLNPILRHIPTAGERGEKIGVYCIAKNLLANEKVFVYLQKNDVEKVKKASKSSSGSYSPWNTWEEEMWKKTAVKRIVKLLPLSAEGQAAVGADETIKTKIDPDMASVPDETEWDGETIENATESPVTDEVPNDTPEQEKVQPEVAQPVREGPVISEPQRKRLFAIAMGAGMEKDGFKEWLLYNYNYTSSTDILKADYDTICAEAEVYQP